MSSCPYSFRVDNKNSTKVREKKEMTKKNNKDRRHRKPNDIDIILFVSD